MFANETFKNMFGQSEAVGLSLGIILPELIKKQHD